MLVNYMFNKISKKTKYSAFELLAGTSLVFLVGFVLYRLITGKSKEGGTWTKKKYYELLPITTTQVSKNKSSPEPKNVSKGEAECKRVLKNYLTNHLIKQGLHF